MLKLQRPQQNEAENVGWEEGQCATEQGRPTRSQQAVELAHDGCGEQAETCTPSGRSTCLDTTSPLETPHCTKRVLSCSTSPRDARKAYTSRDNRLSTLVHGLHTGYV
jgi:hypothetical protein